MRAIKDFIFQLYPLLPNMQGKKGVVRVNPLLCPGSTPIPSIEVKVQFGQTADSKGTFS
jgi:hypothetical protein